MCVFSDPHITVMPSHVDVKTQGCMQMLDSNFVGLIFSVFDRGGDMNVCAFQSQGVGASIDECSWSRVEIPICVTHLQSPFIELQPSNERCTAINISNHKMESLISLQQTILGEAQSTFEGALLGATPVSGEGYQSSNRQCSELELCRLTSVYHLNLLRIMDVQLMPTLHGLQSRRRSLEEEKRRLLNSTSYQDSSADTIMSSVNEKDHQRRDDVLEVLESTEPQWTRGVRALRVASAGSRGVLATCTSIPFFSNTSELRKYSVRIVRSTHPQSSCLIPSEVVGMGYSTGDPHVAMLPWSIELTSDNGVGTICLPLISIREGALSLQVEILVRDSVFSASGSDCENSANPVQSQPHNICLEFTDLADSQGSPSHSVVAHWREDLARALRLEVVAGVVRTPKLFSSNDSSVIDITTSQTQTQ